MFKPRHQLAAVVLLSCVTMIAPFYAHAAHTTSYELTDNGNNMSIYIDDMQNSFVNFKVYSATSTGNSEKFRDFFTPGNGINIVEEQQAIANGLAYAKDLLGSPAETPTIRLFLEAEVYNNAAAASDTMDNGNTGIGNYFILKESIPDEYKFKISNIDGEELVNADTCVWIWPRNTCWDASDVGNLSRNIDTQSMSSVIVHELFHALGMSINHYAFIKDDDEIGYKIGVDADANYANKYTLHSYDIYGKQAQVGDEIVYINAADKDKYHQEDGKFYMYLSNGYDAEGNAKHTYDSGCYFMGAHVGEVLTINGSLANLAFPVDSSITVPGLPLNGDEGYPELSHIELQNSFLSHQYFRNWSVPMEAELAMMQDLGYTIDRRNFFGFSVYNDGLTITNNNGFFKRNEAGTEYIDGEPNKQDWGVGLHVYGQKNNITQKGNLFADGDYAIGIRLDGTQDNVLNLQSEVTANGKGGNGIAVTWGRNHTVNIENGASVKALGDGGVALRFDFGHNDIGDDVPSTEIVGSYIYYKNYRHTAYDMIFPASKLLTALDGPLVKECNINGAIEGKDAAIYISKNALVKEISINEGASIKGNIISEWNPKGMWFSESDPIFLANRLPEDEDGLTNININTDLTFTDNIVGNESLVLNVAEGKTFVTKQAEAEATPIMLLTEANTSTAGSSTATSTSATPSISVQAINIANNASYNNQANLTIDNGSGTITIGESGKFTNDGTLNTVLFGCEAGTKFAGSGSAELNGKVNATFMPGYFGSNTTINWLADGSSTDIRQNISTLEIDLESLTKLAESSTTISNIAVRNENGKIVIDATRAENAYSQFADDSISAGIGKAFDLNASSVTGNARKLVAAIDYANDSKAVNSALKQLNPSVFSNSAQATLNTHSMLNNLNMLGSFSNNIPVPRTGGGRGPAAKASATTTADASALAAKAEQLLSEPQHNSWRNIVIPFSAYTDQHSGARGYTNHNSGVIGSMERTLDNGLTHGYHAALNHQSTSEAGSRIKGEGLYLGAQATYAPADWNGWSVFGSARLGVEQMRSHRKVFIPGATGGYLGKADADWTGYSGSFNIGAALTKEHGVMQSGPFAALDYSFAHRPSVHENGGAIRTNLESASYDSLRTQLGYRLVTKPKALDSYDSTKWQAHASVAWNHELLSDNGSISYQLVDLPGVTITDKAETYGRDSMSVAAGVTFKTPNRLDVGLTLGSDIYRKGGSAVYGKVNFEWKF